MEVLGKDGVRVPLLVIYSSELEEKCLAFWYRSMRGENAILRGVFEL